ncbi:MAG: DUF488 family protein [Gemmatimonadota bacterium]|nr:DUF488 family protein [Gemmatimonadota bacterium]
MRVKRVYEPASAEDGYRVLVDRVWPRGLSKGAVAVDEWLPDVAPSTELRRWFGHDPSRWEEFNRRYHGELVAAREEVEALLERATRHAPEETTLTLVYSARDTEHNQAVSLKAFLERRPG